MRFFLRYLERNRIDHTYACLARESGVGSSTSAPKSGYSGEDGNVKVRGLEGDMGDGLGWLCGQNAIDDFNSLEPDQGHVLLVTSDLFRSGGLLPRQADVVVVLSENWGVEQTDIKHCYLLRVMGMESNPGATHLRIIRVVSKGTLEEVLARKQGRITDLQGLKISGLLQAESTSPSIDCQALVNDAITGMKDTSCVGSISPTDRCKSVRSSSFSSATSTSSMPAGSGKEMVSDLFLSCAPSMIKGQGIPSSSRSRSRSRSKSMSLSIPMPLPPLYPKVLHAAENAAAAGVATALAVPSPAEELADADVVNMDSEEGAAAIIMVESSSKTLSLSNPTSDTSAFYEVDSPYSIAAGASCNDSSVPDSDTPTVRIDDNLFSDSAEDETPTSDPIGQIERSASDVRVDLNGISSGENHSIKMEKISTLRDGEDLDTNKTKLNLEGDEATIEEEILADRWKRAFSKAFKDVEKCLTYRGNEVSSLELNFTPSPVPMSSALPFSMSSSLFGPPSSSCAAASTLTQGVVVKRTYAPRKKSDLSLDSNGEIPMGKNANQPLVGSLQLSKGNEEDDEIDGKKDKSRKADRKKEKRKSSLSPVGGIAISTSTTSFSSGTPSTLCLHATSVPSVVVPPIVPPSAPIVVPSSTSSSTSATAIVKDEDMIGTERTSATESSETMCNYGSEDMEEKNFFESCWSADRLAHTMLSYYPEGFKSFSKDRAKGFEKKLFRQGLTLRMAYIVSREWQQQVENANEELMAGVAKPPVPVPRGLLNSSGTQNPVGRPPSNPTPMHVFVSPTLQTASSLPDLNNTSGASTVATAASSSAGIAPPFNASHYFKSHGRLKLRPEFGLGSHYVPPQKVADSEGRLNRKNFSESDKVRLRRAGLGVTDAEQLFWSLIEPFISTPLDKAKEILKRPPGSLGGNTAQVPPTALPTGNSQPFSAISFHDTIRELRRKGISVDSHVHVHPLQNAMRCDLQLVPSWQRKSAISDSHTHFAIRYVVPRSSSSKNSRKSRAQVVNPRGERDKEPVRKRILDQPMLIPNIRNVRSRLEAGANSRPSSLGGTVNPLFTRLPPIRTLLKSKGKLLQLTATLLSPSLVITFCLISSFLFHRSL